MPILNSIASWLMKKRMHQIELFVKYPIDVQQEWMYSLLKDASKTKFGKKNHFTDIKNYEQFKEQIPLNDYDSLKPYIERTRRGEQNLLWHSEIKWFAKSSGTNEKSKFLPVSQESLNGCHYNAGRDMITLHCFNNPETELFRGKNLALGGSFKEDQFENHNSFHGDVSAIIIQNLPMWAEFFRAPETSIALMDEWEGKLEKMALSMMNENVTSLAGVPSWMLVLLNRILEKKKAKTINEVWPNLEVYFHGGVSFEPYKEQFLNLFNNNKVNFLQLYSASEGFFGIQDLSNSEELLLMLDYGIYYEFLPMEHIDDEQPKTLSLNEVELDKNYALIISTNAGLWRYQIGDTIKFTSLSPYRIQITGRTKHFINAFGEELIIDNAEKALAKACAETACAITEYTACPIYFKGNEAGAHEWIIEFEQAPKELARFTEILDQNLRELNSDYDAKRYKDMALGLPKIHQAPNGTFYTWMKNRGKLGGQHKVPRLANERKYVEEILKLL